MVHWFWLFQEMVQFFEIIKWNWTDGAEERATFCCLFIHYGNFGRRTCNCRKEESVMRVWIIVLLEWEKYQKKSQRIRPICRMTNKGAIWKINYKAVNLNRIDITGLIKSVHSTIEFHMYIQLLSQNVINLNGNINVTVTFWLFKFVNISIGMGPNEDWWRRKYMSEIIYICMHVCMYITNHLLAYEMWSLVFKMPINVLNLLSLNNTIHINIYRYVLYHSKYCNVLYLHYLYSHNAVYCCCATCFFPYLGYPWWWLSWAAICQTLCSVE
jgi:hypothetical protein